MAVNSFPSPQLKLIVPPVFPNLFTHACNAAWVQEALVPVPTTHLFSNARVREGRVRQCRSRASPNPLQRNAVFLIVAFLPPRPISRVGRQSQTAGRGELPQIVLRGGVRHRSLADNKNEPAGVETWRLVDGNG